MSPLALLLPGASAFNMQLVPTARSDRRRSTSPAPGRLTFGLTIAFAQIRGQRGVVQRCRAASLGLLGVVVSPPRVRRYRGRHEAGLAGGLFDGRRRSAQGA